MTRRTASTCRLRLLHIGLTLTVALGAAACSDAPTDPLAQLMTGETAEAAGLPVVLPGLTELAVQAGVEETVAPQLVEWQSSWDDPARGAVTRANVVHDVAPVIADALGAGGVSLALSTLHRVEQDLALLEDVPADVAFDVASVRSLVRESRLALDEGRTDFALTAGLLAADRMRELGPRAVARTLVARADRALMATVGVETVDALSLSRGERMLDGARAALAEGHDERAVQRAFYAVQLLEQALAPARR